MIIDCGDDDKTYENMSEVGRAGPNPHHNHPDHYHDDHNNNDNDDDFDGENMMYGR